MEHLSEQQINLILNGSVGGVEMKNALLHIETCVICQEKMPKLAKSDLLGIILNKPLLVKESLSEITQTSKPIFWNWQSAFVKTSFAGILLLIFGSLVFWFFKTDKEIEIVKNPNNSVIPTQINNSNNDLNSNTNSVFANNSIPNENIQTVQQNTILSNKVKNSVTPKPTETPREIVPNLNLPNNDELAINLEKYPKSLVGLESPNVQIRGNNNNQNKFFVRYPIGEVIGETQPVLLWNPIENSDSYIVTVYDENYNEVYSKEVNGTSVRIETPLKRGEKYQWQVKTKLKNAENTTLTTSPSIFRIAKTETVNKVDKIKVDNSAKFKKVEYFYKEGLLTEAEKILNEILKKNPKDKLAIKYLQQIKNVRNKTQKPPTETKPAQ
ncbi:MAG: DUF928 domain-containing protein [Pyrinomonadaceae bacterium]|nr:DUF928 domain-containing protein [Pyrinomonadaceae bacterium]